MLLCYTLPGTLCYVLLCHVRSCYVMPCFATLKNTLANSIAGFHIAVKVMRYDVVSVVYRFIRYFNVYNIINVV